MDDKRKLLQLLDREEWRTWLQAHHTGEKEAWLVIRKKHAGRPGIDLDEAVEEALCFGWIDSAMRPIDSETFALRFSPRKPGSIWSEANKRRVARLLERGMMAEAGLARVREAQESGEWERASRREDTTVLPADLQAALEADEAAHCAFEKLAPSTKKQYIWWIASARMPETRRRRIAETLRLAMAKKRPETE